MAILEWILACRETVILVIGILINAGILVYNIYKLVRSGGVRDLQCWLRILEAARQYETEAEACSAYDGAEKLNYVLTKLRQFSETLNYRCDEDRLVAQVEADLAFSKKVNAGKTETAEETPHDDG